MHGASETWMDIKGFEGLYQISSLGEVKSLAREVLHPVHGTMKIRERILKKTKGSRGYYAVNLFSNGVREFLHIHYLVADAFLEKKRDGRRLVVDHINGDKEDNRVENLQIIPFRENVSRAFKDFKCGTFFHKRAKKWAAHIYENGKSKYLGLGKTREEAMTLYQNYVSSIKQ